MALKQENIILYYLFFNICIENDIPRKSPTRVVSLIFHDLIPIIYYLTGINMYYSLAPSKEVPVAFARHIIEIYGFKKKYL